ncbi:MAG: CcoQ/FixQ family Cbb3-type cytochrome c oxidase assembly chaperone [Saprospiraceae bacterium]
MKFGDYLKTIDHVDVFPVLALIMFVSVFVGVVCYIYSLNKSDIAERANIPLD